MTTEEFISKAKKVHGDKYDYSLVEYVNNKTRVTIICPIHGEFKLYPNDHLNGHGCKYCGNAAKHTKEEFIEAARKVHGDKYDYSLVEYVNNKTKVKIICPIHGEFKKTPSAHLNGLGCQKCVGRQRYTTETFIEAARKVHGDKYDYSKVEYVNNQTYITIICPIHGEFKLYPSSHLRGHGCLYCGGSTRLTTEEFIKRSREVHGNKYDYSKVKYVNSTTPIIIICPEHGEFKKLPHAHLKGEGCQKCNGIKRYTTEIFIEEARKIHGDKYDYSKVKFIDTTTKVKIICPIHGEFKLTPKSHLRGCGCTYCGDNLPHTKESFVEAARKIHGDYYDYSKVEYVNNKTDVIIICPKHGEFKQTPHCHLSHQGCPKCKLSKLVENVIRKLELNDIQYIIEQKFDWLIYKSHMRLDIYLPKYNAAIECHGLQHFEPIDYFGGEDSLKLVQDRDKHKHDLCKSNNVKLFYFSDSKIDNYSLGRVYNDVDELLNAIMNEL